jgi:Zn-dependent M16 (insulinase) family peptidase
MLDPVPHPDSGSSDPIPPSGAFQPEPFEQGGAAEAHDLTLGDKALPGLHTVTTTKSSPVLQHGFELLRDERVAEIDAQVRIYRHQKSGANLMTITCADENNVFTASFRTPPPDSSGLTHILEHSVLEGSKKYPVKGLFDQLSKSSLKTYLNASTSIDETYYTAGSRNQKDFANLVEVYLDCVFHPLLKKETFLQEGWHHELDDLQGPLSTRGVVFNEMKGAYSSPSKILYLRTKEALFPDTPYAFDSGGDPAEISTLTYEALTAYHQKFYHPSNARLLFYGNGNESERLRLADEALGSFDARYVDSDMPLQPPLTDKGTLVCPYAVSPGSDLKKSAYVTENWLLGEREDAVTDMALELLDDILLKTTASPLRRALIESGLGDGLAGSGLRSGQRQLSFSIGLKGCDPAQSASVVAATENAFKKLVQGGIDRGLIEATINSYEFALRECNTGSQPRGMTYIARALNNWNYGMDPVAALHYEEPLRRIRERVAAGEPLFEDLIRKYFLNNDQRRTVILEPTPDLTRRQDADEASRHATALAAMPEDRRREILTETAMLQSYQSQPLDPTLLATLPTIDIADLGIPSPDPVASVDIYKSARVIHTDLFTSGISYLHAGFDLRALPEDLLPYVPLFGRSLSRMDNAGGDFSALARRIDQSTGGISWAYDLWVDRPAKESAGYFFLKGKALAANTSQMLDIMSDMLLSANLDNQPRFLEMIKERRILLEDGVVSSGSATVGARLEAHFHPHEHAKETMSGIDQLVFLKSLSVRAASDWPSVLADLERLRGLLVNRKALILNVTLDKAGFEGVRGDVERFIDKFPEADYSRYDWKGVAGDRREGFAVPARVNYVGKALNLYDHGYAYDGSIRVIKEFLDNGWLHEKIRVQGGAYGGSCRFDRGTGVFALISYRDPNIKNSLDVFDETVEFLRNATVSPSEMKRNIIGAMGRLDPALLPDSQGYQAMMRYLRGVSPASKQKVRDQVLNTKPEDFAKFASFLEKLKSEGHVVVLGSKDALDKANQDGGLSLQIKEIS